MFLTWGRLMPLLPYPNDAGTTASFWSPPAIDSTTWYLFSTHWTTPAVLGLPAVHVGINLLKWNQSIGLIRNMYQYWIGNYPWGMSETNTIQSMNEWDQHYSEYEWVRPTLFRVWIQNTCLRQTLCDKLVCCSNLKSQWVPSGFCVNEDLSILSWGLQFNQNKVSSTSPVPSPALQVAEPNS